MKKYLAGLFVVFSVPLIATAATTDDLQAQIAALIAQITQLQSQLQGQKTTVIEPVSIPKQQGGAHCYQFARTMSRGSRGADVTTFQQYLVSLGLLSTDSATGFYGALTEAAVQKWQSQNGIVSYGDAATTGWGVFGSHTQTAMLAACTKTPTITQEPTGPVTQTCPLYQTPVCLAGQHVVQPVDARGCAGIPQCQWGQNSCPIYNACPSGATTVTTLDSKGCNVITCTAPTIICPSGTHLSNNQCVSDTTTTITTSNSSITASVSPLSVVQGAAPLTSGDPLNIYWTSQNAPTNAAVGLWLIKTDGTNYGVIAGQQATTGSYAWSIPGPHCDSKGNCMYQTDSPNVYYTDIGTYYVLAKLYTPQNAYLGGYPLGNPANPTYVASGQSNNFTVTGPIPGLVCGITCPVGSHSNGNCAAPQCIQN